LSYERMEFKVKSKKVKGKCNIAAETKTFLCEKAESFTRRTILFPAGW